MVRREAERRRRMAAAERGTWREALRADFAPWFDDLDWGFICGDGWSEVIRVLTQEITEIVGGPAGAPRLRVFQVKEQWGVLRYDVLGVSLNYSAAIGSAIDRAEARSAQTCESCGAPGALRKPRGGRWHTACDEHAVDKEP